VAENPNFDITTAHRFFSADCFNKAWELIEKPDRTAEEDEQMIRLNQASIWHWTQREDCANMNMSIGYWQASRIHAILGHAGEARRYGQLCLQYSQQEAPFLLAYAYEALARAEQLAGNESLVKQYHTEAIRLAEAVTDPEDKQFLLNDLNTLK
jgi:hypothetical protein